MSFENDESVAAELGLFTENDGDIYRRTTLPILTSLATKKAQGKYDHDKAVDAFMYLAEAGAKEYIRQHGSPGDVWHEMFPISVRRMAATRWRDEFEEEFRLGNYDGLLPKKYQNLHRAPKTTTLTGSSYHAYEVGEDVWWWGSQGTKIIGTVIKVHFVGERPDYEVKIHGESLPESLHLLAGSIVMKAEHELASETGRQRLASQTRAADRRKGKPRTCPACKGTGSRKLTDLRERQLQAQHGPAWVARYGKRCPKCGGAGTLS